MHFTSWQSPPGQSATSTASTASTSTRRAAPRRATSTCPTRSWTPTYANLSKPTGLHWSIWSGRVASLPSWASTSSAGGRAGPQHHRPWHENRACDSDQRCPPEPRVVPLPAKRLPGRAQLGRPTEDARRFQGRQARAAYLPEGDAGAAVAAEAGVEHNILTAVSPTMPAIRWRSTVFSAMRQVLVSSSSSLSSSDGRNRRA